MSCGSPGAGGVTKPWQKLHGTGDANVFVPVRSRCRDIVYRWQNTDELAGATELRAVLT